MKQYFVLYIFTDLKGGKIPIEKKHPNLVEFITNFIEQNSAEAHLRRRDDVMYNNGVTLQNIVDHVRQKLGISVSRNTIHRLMKAPRQNTIASKRFKGLINARVPPKRNTKEKQTHRHFHYTCAQINLVNEMAEMFRTGTVSMSVDNKNKVEVGNPATSRRSKIRTFHLMNSGINYHDHDFPYRNTKLTPAGYMNLRHKLKRSRSFSPDRKKTNIKRSPSLESLSKFTKDKTKTITVDKNNRNKILWPRSGPLNVHLYPCRSIETTNIMHVHHLLEKLTDKVKLGMINLVCVADGGPD